MSSINDAINKLQDVISGKCGISCLFGFLSDAIAKLPDIAERFVFFTSFPALRTHVHSESFNAD